MKNILYLFILILLTACYKETNNNPNHPVEYFGIWNNEKTTIKGNLDDINPYNKVQHYVFNIGQSEITLSTSSSLGSKYQNWKVDKTSNPYTLILYEESPTTIPSIVFKIIKEPALGKMEISYNDSIVYYLKK